jgi:hypothetical protein
MVSSLSFDCCWLLIVDELAGSVENQKRAKERVARKKEIRQVRN